MIRMKPIRFTKGASTFCGPSAISAIAGVATGRAQREINRTRRERDPRPRRLHQGELKRCAPRAIKAKVCGVYAVELQRTLSRMGFLSHEIRSPLCGKMEPEPMTLAAFFRSSIRRDYRRELLLIATTNHFIVVQGDAMEDNAHRRPFSFARYSAKHGRRQITDVLRIIKVRKEGAR